MILFPFVGDTIGGSHHSAVLLMQSLVSQGVKPVALLHRKGVLESFLRDKGITVSAMGPLPVWEAEGGSLRNLWRMIAGTPRLMIALRHMAVDGVHVNDGRMAISWSLACRLAGVPLIIHQRTRFAPSRLSRLALSLASRIITISDYTRETLPADLRGRAVTVPNPFLLPSIDRAAARRSVEEEFGLDPSVPLLLFVGTFQKQKRPLVAVDAVMRMHARGQRAVLMMVGRHSGEEGEALLRDITAKGLVGRDVLIPGFRSDIDRLMAAADLLIAPAVNEGHGRALVEALLAGTPVVAADSGGHREVGLQEGGGYLVPPDDPDAFAERCLQVVANDIGMQDRSAVLREPIERLYSQATHGQRVAAEYRRAMGSVAVVIESMGGGGAQQVASRLLTHWVDRGDEPALITFQPSETDVMPVPAGVRRWETGGVGISQGVIRAVVANVRRLLTLRRAVKLSNASIVVSFVGTTNILVLLATLGLRKKVIVSERNDPRRQRVGGVWRILRWVMYPCAWKVTANSFFALSALSPLIRKNRRIMVPNPLRKKGPAAPQQFPFPVIMAVGRLHPQKHFDLLLQAFAQAKRQSSALEGWRLVILGEGGERKALEAEAARLGIASDLLMPGHVSDPYPYLQASQVFVMCSRYEGSPNALWEAMACGLPTVITDTIEGALEWVTPMEQSYVVPGGDKAALATALAVLAANPSLREALGNRASKLVDAFSDDKVFAVWDSVLYEK